MATVKTQAWLLHLALTLSPHRLQLFDPMKSSEVFKDAVNIFQSCLYNLKLLYSIIYKIYNEISILINHCV